MSRVYHLDGRNKYKENSLRGIDAAAAGGYAEIDIDILKDVFGNDYGCHYPRPMLHEPFRDEAGKMNRNMNIRDMTPAQIARLVAGDDFRIQPLKRLLRHAVARGVTPRLEPKNDVRYEDPVAWRKIRRMADEVGAYDVCMYTLRNLGGKNAGVRRWQAARAAGIPGRVLR